MPYSVVFLGTPDFAVPALISLLEDPRFEVPLIVSQADKPQGRGLSIKETPVKQVAKSYSIPCFQGDDMTELEARIKFITPDFLVVIAYGKILPPSVLSIAKWNINLHGSILPKYRGASPIQSALLSNETETGVSVMNIEEKMDAGAVYQMHRIPILLEDTSETLFTKIAEMGKKLPPDLIDIASGKTLPKIQNEEDATYCKKIQKEDGYIDFSKNTAQEIFNKLRAFTPWPGIYFEHKGKRIKILSGSLNLSQSNQGIKTKDGIFYLQEITPEGKKTILFSEWLRNNKDFLS